MKLQNIIIFLIIILFLKYYKLEKTTFIKIHENNELVELPNNIQKIHTIYINDKIVPIQLFIQKNELVKWVNNLKNIHIVNLLDSKYNKIFRSKNLLNNEFDYYIFDTSGTFYFYIDNISYITYEIIVK